jgi:hypothetical protein
LPTLGVDFVFPDVAGLGLLCAISPHGLIFPDMTNFGRGKVLKSFACGLLITLVLASLLLNSCYNLSVRSLAILSVGAPHTRARLV